VTEIAAVLSPHLDDAVLSAWSVLRGAVEVRVVNVCTGMPPAGLLSPWDRVTGASDSRTRMSERLDEDRDALALAGRESIALGFRELQYRDEPLDGAALAAAVRAAVDGAAVIWAPAGIGGHDDHVQIRDAALELANDGGAPVRLYADLPYATKFGWPGWVTGIADDPHLVVEHWWERFLPAHLRLAAARRELSDAEAERKLRAIAAYRTQATALDGGPLGVLRHPRVIRHEVSWSLR
jgi:LmbE family N-acetylglucosaminyl deacetylase